MAEANEAQSDDPHEMLRLVAREGDQRKLRLYACAAVRCSFPDLPEPFGGYLALAERYADGLLSAAEFKEIRLENAEVDGGKQAARRVMAADARDAAKATLQDAIYAAGERATLPHRHHFEGRRGILSPELMGPLQEMQRDLDAALRAAHREQADLLREVFGDPSHPAAVDPAWLEWAGGSIPALARSIYEERAFDRMPALAEALDSAGCADARILDHCRSGRGHVRGCWVLDALLGNAAGRPVTAAPCAGGIAGGLRDAVEGGDAGMVRSLLQAGVDPNVPDEEGVSPLARAADAGRLDVVRALVESGARVDGVSANPTGENVLGTVVTPLLLAGFRGHHRVYDYLHRRAGKVHRKEVGKQLLKIKKKRNKQLLCDPRVAALFRAVKAGDAGAVAGLVADGVTVNVSDEEDWGNSALATAVFRGDLAVVRSLLDGGADPNDEGCSGVLPLLVARDLPVVEALLRAGADPNRGWEGGSALNAAASQNRTDLLAALIAAGAELDAPAELHGCALAAAAARGHLEAVRLLLDAGASVHTCPKNGWPPLMHAAAAGHEAVVRALLDAGADAYFTARDGETALSVAGNHPGVVDLLKRAQAGDG